jgi:uncharacterized protein
MLTCRKLLLAALFACVGAGAFADPATIQYKIVTGPERGTYIQIGQDLARYVAPSGGVDQGVGGERATHAI